MYTKKRTKPLARPLLLFLVLAILLPILLSACGGGTAPAALDAAAPAAADAEADAGSGGSGETETEEKAPLTLEEIAKLIADEFGEIETVVDKGTETVVFVFGENHASILQRLEIAGMLNRLYATQNTIHLGLEGMLDTEPPLDLSWAHTEPAYMPGEPVTCREDVLAHRLNEDEFSSIEFIGLIYEDVVVHGIDDPELYGLGIDRTLQLIPFDYLYAIAIQTMSDADYEFWLGLIDDEDYVRANEFALMSTDYTADAMERYQNLKSPDDQFAMLQEIEDKAADVGAEIYPEEVVGMQDLLSFVQAVSARSDIFVENILEIANDNPGAPVAMEIGAAHLPRVLELLEEAGVSHVSIRPISYMLEEDPSMLSWEAILRKDEGLSPVEPGMLSELITSFNWPPSATNVQIKTITALYSFLQAMQKPASDAAAPHEDGSIPYETMPLSPEEWTNFTDESRDLLREHISKYLGAEEAQLWDLKINNIFMDPDGNLVVYAWSNPNLQDDGIFIAISWGEDSKDRINHFLESLIKYLVDGWGENKTGSTQVLDFVEAEDRKGPPQNASSDTTVIVTTPSLTQ